MYSPASYRFMLLFWLPPQVFQNAFGNLRSLELFL